MTLLTEATDVFASAESPSGRCIVAFLASARYRRGVRGTGA